MRLGMMGNFAYAPDVVRRYASRNPAISSRDLDPVMPELGNTPGAAAMRAKLAEQDRNYRNQSMPAPPEDAAPILPSAASMSQPNGPGFFGRMPAPSLPTTGMMGRGPASAPSAQMNRSELADLGVSVPDFGRGSLFQLQNKMQAPVYGKRPDGASKGTGWLGEQQIRFPDGSTGVATEYSMQSDAVTENGQPIDFPTLVPTLTPEERRMMLEDIIPNNKQPPESVVQKAIQWANDQRAAGESVFAPASRSNIPDFNQGSLLTMRNTLGMKPEPYKEPAQVKGSMMAAAASMGGAQRQPSSAAAPQQLGAFGNSGSFAARNNMENAQPNFFENLIGYDPNKADVPSLGWLFMSPEGRQASVDRVQAQSDLARDTAEKSANLDIIRSQYGEEAARLYDVDPAYFETWLTNSLKPDSQSKKETFTDKDGQVWMIDPYSGKASKVDGLFGSPEGQDAVGGRRLSSTQIDSSGRAIGVFSDGTTGDLGFSVRNPYQVGDVGGVPYFFDRQAGTMMPVVDPDVVGVNAAKVEAGKQAGIAQSDAISNYANVVATSDEAIAAIDELLLSPGFNDAYGLGRLNVLGFIPGSNRKNTEAIRDKLDAKFFLSAVNNLKASLAPLSNKDAERLSASVSQLANPEISAEEARRVALEMKDIFQRNKEKAYERSLRGPLTPPSNNKPLDQWTDEELAAALGASSGN